MAHRPYPSRNRALKQLLRHASGAGAAVTARPLSPFEKQLLDGTATVVRDIGPLTASLRRVRPSADEYQVPTR
ncbi:hypothetical protein [Streptomyces sp. MMG1121]|uniref:hypothetical protein n=1 Tax=Streptomyces sp. MMG1121 TaxID=1415544 RepID=UPI0006B012A5|nr:hypothetical protein [Streptomyces sp. MMG1121]KOV64036.1 hypothetical protein ADK64_18015 [Streptomyces sp. MMG1121]